jgi:hypothetical protein
MKRLLRLHLWVYRVVRHERVVVCSLQGGPDIGIAVGLLSGVDDDDPLLIQVSKLEKGVCH